MAYLGEEVRITRDREEILAIGTDVILAGVGGICDAMEKLHTYGLVDVIREVVRETNSFFGNLSGTAADV